MATVVPDEIERPALEGLALKYNQVLEGTNVAVIPGCFRDHLASKPLVILCLDHNDVAYADSHHGLAITDAAEGVFFRVALEDTNNPIALAGIVGSGNREAVSAKFDILESENQSISGHNIRCVTKARLREISLVRAGKSRHAFAYIVDAARYPPPTNAGVSSDMFALTAALFRIKKAGKAIAKAYGVDTPGGYRVI